MMREKEFDVEGAAYILLDIFEKHSEKIEGAYLVPEEGLNELSIFFGTVPEEERGYVFLSFLADLYEEASTVAKGCWAESNELSIETDALLRKAC